LRHKDRTDEKRGIKKGGLGVAAKKKLAEDVQTTPKPWKKCEKNHDGGQGEGYPTAPKGARLGA